MAQPSSPPANASQPAPAPITVGPGDLRIVLFGLPAAGKTSLLGALSQAAHTQDRLLNGKLIDLNGGLEDLRRLLYEATPRRTAEEVVPHPVRFEPFASPRQPTAPPPIDAVVVDCDGRVANDLLIRKEELDENSHDGTLAREVVEADALVLVVDASAPESQVEADFAEFARFLRQMERNRAHRTEVGGLPVFLVLTKCDLLVQPTDKTGDWMDRIEQRKHEVGARFREFLEREESEQALPFGRLDLVVWATAVKRPALAGVAARPREPYMVAELFRQCLDDAVAFRLQEKHSGRRLWWTVAISGTLVTAMLAIALTLFWVNRSIRTSALLEKVTELHYLDRDNPEERLAGSLPQLRNKEARFKEVKEDPLFTLLPPGERDFVDERLGELVVYNSYLEKIREVRRPALLRSERELAALQERLKAELALPVPEWENTEVGQLHKQLLDESEAVTKAAAKVREAYEGVSTEANRLWTFADYQEGTMGVQWPEWGEKAEKFLARTAKPPVDGNEPIPGAPQPLTYKVVYRLARVVEARAEAEAARARLRRALELACALGLAPATKERPAVLVFPGDFTLDQAGKRLEELKDAYPNYTKTFSSADVSDAFRPYARQAVRKNYGNLLKPARAEVLKRLQAAGTGPKETRERWLKVRSWLVEPGTLGAWRKLALVLVQLEDPSADDPVVALAEFLKQSQFTIRIRGIVLAVPDASPLGLTGAPFKVEERVLEGGGKTLTLAPQGEPMRDARAGVKRYNFQNSGDDQIAFTPGDKFWALLEVRDGLLAWGQCRSQMYQFERLRLPPRLQEKPGMVLSAGAVQEGVTAAVSPEDGLPRVPDLMPEVHLE